MNSSDWAVAVGCGCAGRFGVDIYQILREPLAHRIGQLERDPFVHSDVVRHLRGTAADLEMAAYQYRDWLVGKTLDLLCQPC
jgi:hypothetical protein